MITLNKLKQLELIQTIQFQVNLITTIHFLKQATRMDKSTIILNDFFHSLK